MKNTHQQAFVPKKIFSTTTNSHAAIEKDISFLEKFGARLKQLRKQRGTTQAQSGSEANIEISQISRIERGLINTTIMNAQTIAKVLEIPIKELFDFE